MNTYIHPILYYIIAFIICGLLVMSVFNDILKKNKVYANFNIYFDFLLSLKYVLHGLHNRVEIKITDNYIEMEEKKRYDCIQMMVGEVIWQKFTRWFFCIGFGYNIGKFLNLIFVFKIKDLDIYDYICLYPYTLLPIILIIEIIITDFRRASEEGTIFIIPTLVFIGILFILAFLLDWAYYQDIKKVSIGLGISFVLMVISYFLFNLIANCTESKVSKNYTKVEKDKVKFLI